MNSVEHVTDVIRAGESTPLLRDRLGQLEDYYQARGA